MVIILGVSTFLFIVERQHLINQMKENQITIVNGLAQVSKESLITKNQILLLNYISLLMRNKEIVYVLLTDSTGKILAHTNIHLLGEIDRTPAGFKAKNAKKLLTQSYQNKKGEWISDFAFPLFVKQERLGIARVGFSQQVLNAIVQETVTKTGRRIFGVALVALVVGILGSLILAQTMTKPIRKLTQGVELVGKGKLDMVIEVNNRDELGKLAKEFNLMACKLKELDQMKQDFTSSVTHELRSPLTSIMMYIDLFFKGTTGQLTEKQKNFLTIMRDSAKRLNNFINDLLDVAKIERGKMEIVREPLNISKILEETVQLFKVQAEAKNIQITTGVPKDLPNVLADQNKIRQVVNNLLSNAIKFTPQKGKINIEIRNIQGYLQISISDTGIGIPRTDLEKIFDKFEQVKGVRNKIESSKGTGLGLAIVKAIIELHRGKIWVESNLGKGSTFYFVLPKVTS